MTTRNPGAIERRRQLVALALRRARPGSGSDRAFLLQRTWKGLPAVDIDLTKLNAPYAIVGGVATALYMPQRATLDLGLLAAATDADALYRELEAAGCERTGALSIGGTTWKTPDGSRLDVLEGTEPWAPEAVSRPNRAPDGLPVIALPYLALMKLDASRAIDLGDLGRMLGLADEATLEEVREVIARYRPQDREDLESFIALGRLELEDEH